MKNISSIYQNDKVYHHEFSPLQLDEDKVVGNIKAEFVVFYHLPEEALLKDDLKQFLFKLLSAVKHDTNNTLIINSSAKVKFKQLKELGFAQKIIFFGNTRNSVGLNLNLKRYKIFNIQAIDCLFVDSLDVLKDDNQRKSALWSLMKTMFRIA